MSSEAREVTDEGISNRLADVVDKGVTVRSVIFGFFVAVAISLLGNTVRYILHASFMA